MVSGRVENPGPHKNGGKGNIKGNEGINVDDRGVMFCREDKRAQEIDWVIHVLFYAVHYIFTVVIVSEKLYLRTIHPSSEARAADFAKDAIFLSILVTINNFNQINFLA